MTSTNDPPQLHGASTVDATNATTPDDPAGALVERIIAAVLGASECQAVYLGEHLGWYDALAELGSATAAELATHTSTDARYAQEWLEQQTVSGYLAVDDAAAPQAERRFRFPPGHEEVLTDRDSLAFARPFASMAAAFGRRLDDLVAAYRSGNGVSWQQQGVDAREGQAAANRPLYLHRLGQEFLPSVPDIDARLRSGARVADVGCGFGWSAIGIALAYPTVTVIGLDVDAPSIEAARVNAEASGVADRVMFQIVDAGDPGDVPGAGSFDLVTAFECIHDLADPVGVLSTMRRLAGPNGAVLVMDEAVGEAFTGLPDPIEQLMYGFSLMCCLPDGRAHQPSAATGTVMRPAVLDRYAVEAGFGGAEVLDIDADFFRFYRLQ